MVDEYALLATGVDADGHREVLGLQATSPEDGTCLLGFLRDLIARGLLCVKFVTGGAHRGLTAITSSTCKGAPCQWCHPNCAASLMNVTPRAIWPWVKMPLHSAYDQPTRDRRACSSSTDLDALPTVVAHLEQARADVPRVHRLPGHRTGRHPSWPNNTATGSRARRCLRLDPRQGRVASDITTDTAEEEVIDSDPNPLSA